MKKIIILLLSISFILTSFNQEDKLNGVYKVEFDSAFKNDGYVSFYGKNFKWRPFHFLPFDGKINYLGNKIYLENESNLLYIIDYKYIKKDTIIFYVHDKKEKGNYLDIAIGTGKFIKEK